MTSTALVPAGWRRAYRPLRPRGLAVQLVVVVMAEVAPTARQLS